ncbi:MAG: hypothetical protein KIT73_05610 [Burkholderiales bacterium]|nr:hypothetical protein [Burkholderiales bacterium]
MTDPKIPAELNWADYIDALQRRDVDTETERVWPRAKNDVPPRNAPPRPSQLPPPTLARS